MKAYDNRDKLKLIKRYFILNMLQDPSCFININKASKKGSTNIKQENRYTNNSSTEFTPEVQQEIPENDSEFMLPISDKLSMAKFLITLRLLQRTRYNKNIDKISKNNSININHENKTTEIKSSLINNLKNKFNPSFTFLIRQVTFGNISDFINTMSEINTTTDGIYEPYENENTDYLESLMQTPPIIIEEEDIDIVNPNE
ncbi:MAG: hypothetical protein ACREVX_02230 [Clostridium sp.]|uniref:hypothetical protein n=1 Tax=Clostridium sp. TaxID=1506 RepID=UPI003D6CD2DA